MSTATLHSFSSSFLGRSIPGSLPFHYLHTVPRLHSALHVRVSLHPIPSHLILSPHLLYSFGPAPHPSILSATFESFALLLSRPASSGCLVRLILRLAQPLSCPERHHGNVFALLDSITSLNIDFPTHPSILVPRIIDQNAVTYPHCLGNVDALLQKQSVRWE